MIIDQLKNKKKKLLSQFLVLIPARGASKRIKNKNLVKIKKKSLLEITIENSLKIFDKDNIFVSSDSIKIKKISIKKKINIITRPKKYAKDYSSANEVIEHAINFFKQKNFFFNHIIYLQPTSPFRSSSDIKKSLMIYLNNNCKPVISVCENEICIHKALYLKNSTLNPIFSEIYVTSNSQNFPKTFITNGAIYIFQRKDFLKKKRIPICKSLPYIMSKKKSLDIDTYKDLSIARKLMR